MAEIAQHFQTFSFLLLARMIGFLAFVRLFAPFSAIGQNAVLQTVLAFAMAVPLLPDVIVALPNTTDLTGLDFLMQGLVSVLTGSSFAVLCSIPLRIAATVGEVIDNARGLSANGPLNPVTRDEATPLSSAVTATLSLVIFALGWHLDIIEDLYRLVPASDLKAVGASVQGAALLWVRSVDVLGTMLTRVVPLLALLLAVDIAIGVVTQNLKSGDIGGAETIVKVLIVAVWAILLVQGMLSHDMLMQLRQSFDETVSPLDKLLAIGSR